MKNSATYLNTNIGDKIKFVGVGPFWFNSYINNANENLKIGEIYTVKNIDVFSSWTKVVLNETENKEYTLAWFEKI